MTRPKTFYILDIDIGYDYTNHFKLIGIVLFTIGIDRRNAPERLEKADMVIKDLGEVDFEKLNGFI